MSRSFLALGLLCLAAPTLAVLAPITLDGDFTDWSALAPLADDAGDDAGPVDWGRIWAANDETYLYLRFETGAEVQPDEQQNMRLYLDTDMNAGTGTAYGGIGADLVWEFGWREGDFRGAYVEHADVGLLMAPTVSSTEFEVALRRDARPDGSALLFPGGQVRFLLRDMDSGDVAPSGGAAVYAFAAGSEPVPSLALGRWDPSHLRLSTWNVQNDGLFDGGSAEAAQDRILDAIDPDVMIFNEVWNHSASQVVSQISQLRPGTTWYGVKRDAGNVIVSRFPVLQSWEIDPGYRLSAALLDLGPAEDLDLLVIACHWRCCSADADRQNEADAVIGFLRDARAPGGAITLPEGTPVILGGDLNLVGWRQQLVTLLTGDIQDEGTYGPDAAPDWDGSDFAVPPSRHPDARVNYTWRNDWSDFYPGLLDWICYTGSALELHNHMVLETRTMTTANLALHGLQRYDVTDASDHAPRFADFTLGAPGTAAPPLARAAADLLPASPNPFNPSTELRFRLDAPAVVELRVFDARGRQVRRFPPTAYAAGAHGAVWDGRDDAGRALASGVFVVRMTARTAAGTAVSTRGLTLVE